MEQCEDTREYNGVTVRCRLPRDHAEQLGINLHEPCPVCAGTIEDVFPESGIRCQEHDTREPEP